MSEPVELDLEALYASHGAPARLVLLDRYEADALVAAGRGRDVVITGAAPIWLYLRIAHALHGVAKTLTYRSGQDDRVPIFDHNAG